VVLAKHLLGYLPHVNHVPLESIKVKMLQPCTAALRVLPASTATKHSRSQAHRVNHAGLVGGRQRLDLDLVWIRRWLLVLPAIKASTTRKKHKVQVVPVPTVAEANTAMKMEELQRAVVKAVSKASTVHRKGQFPQVRAKIVETENTLHLQVPHQKKSVLIVQ
jgi:hypothetical protein